MARKTKLTEKELAQITPGTIKEDRDRGYSELKSYGGRQPKVKMIWDLNKDCKADQIFKLQIGSEVALLDKEEFMKALRWV